MAVYYKFKSAKDYDSIPIDGHFISVANLKEKIFESKHLGRGTDFDLVVTNAQTNEEYLDEEMLIPKNTSVLIRRVPGRPRMTIVTAPVTEQEELNNKYKLEDVQPAKSNFVGGDSSAIKYPEDSEWDEFGNDLYAIPEVLPVQSSNSIQDVPPPSKADEDSKIKALIDTPALDWQRQNSDGFGPGRGFGRGIGGRMMGGRGFGRGGFERKTLPPGYICHRCKVPGHFIQHCPTNGDPNFDIRRVKPPTGIPKSMLMATPDGSYALPSGVVAVLQPNEAAFEKEIEGLPSTRSVGDLPPELHCPLCKEVMKDAVLTSKCCFKSFCDKCIRDYIISKSVCVCGATNILADDLLPNKTLRDTISRILESNNSSAENGGSAFQIQDMESRFPQPKAPSPTQSAASKGEQVPPLPKEDAVRMQETAEQAKVFNDPQKMEKGSYAKVAEVSEATHELKSAKELASQGIAPLEDEVVQQQKPISGEAGMKKKKKKARMPLNAAEMQWRASQELAAENYMMPMGPSTYNPFWTGMQPGMEGYINPYSGGMQPGMEGYMNPYSGGMQPGMEGYINPYSGGMPHLGYGVGPLDVPFGGVLPHDPFGMLPFVPPQRDLADFGMGMGFNRGPPIMSREEFEARKHNSKMRREIERRGESRELLKDREVSREVSSIGKITSMQSKSKSVQPYSSDDHHRQRSERSSVDRHTRDQPDLPHPSSSKRKSKSDYDYDYHHQDEEECEYHHKSHHHRSVSSPSAAVAAAAARPPTFSSTTTPASEPPPPQKKTSTSDKKQKVSVFSRISFPAEEDVATRKKRKQSSSSASGSTHTQRGSSVNGYREDYKSKNADVDYEVSSDEDEEEEEERHFKRRPAKYEAELEEEPPRHSSRGSRERDQRSGYSSKHR